MHVRTPVARKNAFFTRYAYTLTFVPTPAGLDEGSGTEPEVIRLTRSAPAVFIEFIEDLRRETEACWRTLF